MTVTKNTLDEGIAEYLLRIFFGSSMTYNSASFFFFLVLFLTVYCILRSAKSRRIWVLAGSIVFYICSGWQALTIVTGSSLIVYCLSKRMGKIYAGYETEKKSLTPKEQVAHLEKYKKRTRVLLISAIILIAGIWIFVKVLRFLGFASVSSFSEMFSGSAVIVPLGISYYTLSLIGYLLDVYWRKCEPEQSYITFMATVIYFPHIMQGPICKYSKLAAQINNLQKPNYEQFCFGLQLMTWGYIKKIVIADRLALFTSNVFSNLHDYAGAEVVLAVIFSAIQIYADFSGCMDIVCGISQAIGIKLDKNFRQPFFSKNSQEFWARWHITLSAWTKEYIYLPISINPRFLKYIGNLRKKNKRIASFVKSFVPLITVWLFTGLWHGTGTDYIVWGLYWCMLMTISNEISFISDKLCAVLKIDKEKKYHKLWQSVKIFIYFAIGRTFTVAGSLAGFTLIWKRVFFENRIWTFLSYNIFKIGMDMNDFVVAILGIIVIFLVDIAHERGISIRKSLSDFPIMIRWTIYYLSIMSIIIFGVYGAEYNASAFIYGQF